MIRAGAAAQPPREPSLGDDPVQPSSSSDEACKTLMKKNRDLKRELRGKKSEDVFEERRGSRRTVDKLSLSELTTAPAFPEWRRRFRDAVVEAAGSRHEEAWNWVLEIEHPDTTLESLADNRSSMV